jgi:uncharacterized membrane protein
MIRRTVTTALGGLAAAILLDRWLGGLSVDDEDRPIRVPIRTRIEIDAPIADVWARLADIERQPEWMTEMKAVRLLTPGPVGVGTRGEADVRIFGITVSDPVEVVEFAPPHRFAIRHDGRFTGGGLITLDTLDGGRRTRVDWAETLVPPVLANLGSILQGPILGRVFQADLVRLKLLVETDVSRRDGSAGPTTAEGTGRGVQAAHPVDAVVSGGNGHGTATAG